MKAANAGLLAALHPISVMGFNNQITGTGTLTFSVPSGTKQGDTGIIIARSTAGINTPTGWSQTGPIWWKVLATNEANFSMSSPGAGNFAATLLILRGADQANPIMAATNSSTVFSGTTVASPSGTPTANAFLVDAATAQLTSTSTTWTMNRGTKVTQNNSGNRWVAVGITKNLRNGEASGSTTWTTTASISSAQAYTILVKAV